ARVRRSAEAARRRKTWPRGPATLLEQIVEGLTCSGGAWRPGLTLDGRARGEQRTEVLHVLRRDAGSNRLCALDARARVERHALNATVKVDAATRTAAVGSDGQREEIAAARTAVHFVRGHQIGRLRTLRFLARPLRRLGPRRSLTLAVARLVLVSALAVLAFAHKLEASTEKPSASARGNLGAEPTSGPSTCIDTNSYQEPAQPLRAGRDPRRKQVSSTSSSFPARASRRFLSTIDRCRRSSTAAPTQFPGSVSSARCSSSRACLWCSTKSTAHPGSRRPTL